jgi:hypothetical protein
MENVLSQINVQEITIKLTDEKLYINTSSSNETFALRSVNGIGVVDLQDDYKRSLVFWKGQLYTAYVTIGSGLFIAILGIYLGFKIFTVLGVGFFILGYYLMNKYNSTKPVLMSAFRIMMSGGNRDFVFYKDLDNSNSILNFIAKVEDTLTSYHKNNG